MENNCYNKCIYIGFAWFDICYSIFLFWHSMALIDLRKSIGEMKTASISLLAVDRLDNWGDSYSPPPRLTVSEWADKYRVLSPESSPEPGKWNTSRAEFQRGIMDALSEPGVERIVFMSSSQVGKTEMINNTVGYFIDRDPCPILVVQPTDTMAQTWSKDRLNPMVRDTAVLRGKIKEARTRDSSNTILHKIFPGGHITIGGANSPASLASRPIRLVLCDEIDRYPASAGTEGDPVTLASKRATTFWNKIIMLMSSPTIKELSRIEAAYNESDKRRYFVPCSECGAYQFLKWANVIWEKEQTEGGKEIHKPGTAVYKCEKCGDEWNDAKRWAAIRSGKWVPTAEAKNEVVIGFHINEISSPWVRLRDMVQSFLEAQKSIERKQAWINTSLGESWEEKGQTVDEHKLYGRREKYAAEVPAGGLVLVCGVDTQDDRLEGEVIAFGEGQESWSIEYFRIYGDLAAPGIWRQLDQQLQKTYKHESGIEMRIVCTCIDTGGHFTDQAYLFCKGKAYRRIFAVKGSSTIGRPIISKATKNNKYKVNLFSIGTDTAKEIIYKRLLMESLGAGYMHFPIKYDNEYFEQLTAEKAVIKFKRGFPVRQWIKIKPRNEVLDIRVYAMAALVILNPNFKKIKESYTDQKEQPKPKEEIEDRPTGEKRGPRTKVKQPGKKNWVTNWGA